jgi:hypothetical protein
MLGAAPSELHQELLMVMPSLSAALYASTCVPQGCTWAEKKAALLHVRTDRMHAYAIDRIMSLD